MFKNILSASLSGFAIGVMVHYFGGSVIYDAIIGGAGALLLAMSYKVCGCGDESCKKTKK